jgi:hypothetical protein
MAAAPFDIEVKSDRIRVKIEALPGEVKGALTPVTQLLAEELKSVAQAFASGVLVGEITGKYVASFRTGVRTSAKSVTGRVHTTARQAAILEYGGTIPAHDIAPDAAKALAFMMGAGQAFAARVHHPASRIEKRGVLHAALDDMAGTIVSGLTGAVRDTAAQVSER